MLVVCYFFELQEVLLDFDIIVVVVVITIEPICSRTVYNVELEASID